MLSFSQNLTPVQQKALLAGVAFANHSADEVTAVVKSLIAYQDVIKQRSSWRSPSYVCPVQLEDFYYNQALEESKKLGDPGAEVISSMKKLRGASELIDQKCKALDTYHKLEDYKKDNFAAALQMITDLISLVDRYREAQNEYAGSLQKVLQRINAPATAYAKADKRMRSILDAERRFLDLWKYNLNEEIATGWITDELQKSILQNDEVVEDFQKNKPVLKYPASSMWPSFTEGLASILETKRRGLDEYNLEARQSDRHKNQVYFDLINYYNGTLVAFYNSFIGYGMADQYYGIEALKYVPALESTSSEKKEKIQLSEFKDTPHRPFTLLKQSQSISHETFLALTNYVDFLQETWRQTSLFRDVMRNFNGSAKYYRGLTSFQGRGGLQFDNKDFVVPLSYYQKAISDSKVLAPVYATSLREQAEVILNILKEMEQISAVLQGETKTKKYEQDRLDHIYQLIERSAELLQIWDERKEILQADLRSIFDSYPPLHKESSWYISGMALRMLTDQDHDALFQAKNFYLGKGDKIIPTALIDQSVRDVIAREYENMKGIQKIGRNNGLCPYTPYEDLPEQSRRFSEDLKALKPAKPEDNNRYSHPYHSLVYSYNTIVDHYNKFCELSQVPMLKTVKQPELFTVEYPSQEHRTNQPSPSRNETTTAGQAVTDHAVPSSDVVSDRPAVVNTTKVVHDTVYIERRDTIYVGDDKNLRSMEGYAINNLVLLLDVSGSMNAPDKLPLLKKSVLSILSMMRKEDELSIIIFSEKPKVLLPPSSFKDEEKIEKAISNLKSSGKTDGNAGLKQAYKVADENYIRGGNNRIILATDGEFNISDEVSALIQSFATQDIFLSVFNFGKASSSTKSLERLSMLGKGNYEMMTQDNAELKLIREIKSKRSR